MLLKRRRTKKTEYRQRLALLKSRKTRLVIRRYANNIRIQFVSFDKKGDKTLVEKTSRNIEKLGWKGHSANLPAAYLVGLLAGKEAVKKGVKEVVVDLGLHFSMKGGALYSAVKGVKDAGVEMPLGEAVPKDDRIKGTHISLYAKKLKSEDDKKYSKQFSDYIKKGIHPENLPSHFEEIKEKILKGE